MITPVSLKDITHFLNSELKVQQFSDIALNGLQLESPTKEIQTIACAVDCGLSVIEEAIALGAQLLIVHHGLFWGKLEPLTGAFAKKTAACMTKGLSIYAAHLPLDGHPTLGNAAQLATSVLGAQDVEPAFEYHGSCLGVEARLTSPMDITEIASLLAACEGALSPPLVLPFGRSKIRTVGVVTGSGTAMISEAASRGLDLLISGEAKQEAYHMARELECSVIFMGHYASETFGVRALQRVLESQFGVQAHWISQPTGI